MKTDGGIPKCSYSSEQGILRITWTKTNKDGGGIPNGIKRYRKIHICESDDLRSTIVDMLFHI